LSVPTDVEELIVRKTKKASAAFIKELMRRAAQYQLQTAAADTVLARAQVDSALEEMLFSGGSLNVKLLGGATEE